MARPFILLALLGAGLAGCGPSLDAERIAGRTVMVTNDGESMLTVNRIVANGQEGRAECVDEPGVSLGPGRSYTTTFFLCDEVGRVDIETDGGSRAISFD